MTVLKQRSNKDTAVAATSERRGRERIEIETGVQLMAPNAAGVARLRNISVSGLLCVTDTALPEMATFDLLMKLPALPEERDKTYRIEATGLVVRCVPIERGNSRPRFEVAFCFTELNPKDRAQLEQFIERRRS
ncbi:MAG: PilZ domain-containing protein [Planctomycetota bacterium]